PFDLEGEATPARFAAAVPALLADQEVDALLCLHVATPTAPPTDTARAVAAAAKDAHKPVLAAWLGSIDRSEPRAALEAGGVINFYTPENAVDAFSFVASYRRNQEWLLEVPPPLPELGVPDVAAALRVRKLPKLSPTSTVNVCVYTDAVFGPIIGYGNAVPSAAELSLMLPPLNQRLALDLIKSANGDSVPAGLDSLATLLLRVSALVCA